MFEVLLYWHLNIKQPIIEMRKYDEVFTANVSCYNAEVAQTDNDPKTMANGRQVFEGAIANNYYKFGTRVEVNSKEYIVSDRMNKKYGKNDWDIFMWSYNECIKFGRQKLTIKVK